MYVENECTIMGDCLAAKTPREELEYICNYGARP